MILAIAHKKLHILGDERIDVARDIGHRLPFAVNPHRLADVIHRVTQLVLQGIEELGRRGVQPHHHHRVAPLGIAVGEAGIEVALCHLLPHTLHDRVGTTDTLQVSHDALGVVVRHGIVYADEPITPRDVNIADYHNISSHTITCPVPMQSA